MLRTTSNHAMKSTAVTSAGILSLVATLAFAGPALAAPSSESSEDPSGSTSTAAVPEVSDDVQTGTGGALTTEPGGSVTESEQDLSQSDSEEVEAPELEVSRTLTTPAPTSSESIPVDTSACGVIPQGVFSGSVSGSEPRISGATRYETASNIATTVSSVSVGEESAVFIATGTDFADGLTLGALAAHSGWPLLLAHSNGLDASAKKVIAGLHPTHIYIAGGTGAVSTSVEKQIIEATGRPAEEVTVKRFAGADRYETSAEIAECFPEGAPAFVTTGANFADGVVAGAPAAKQGGPVILTATNKINASAQAALERVRSSSVSLIGGQWSSAEISKIKKATGATSVATYSGADRYATSVKVANAFYGTSPTTATFATGTTFPDALAGVSVATVTASPIVLTTPTCRPKSVEALSNTAKTKVILGGTGAVSKASYTTTCVPKPAAPTKTLLSVAKQQVGKRYANGATGPNAFDCSGLTQYVYRQMGVTIPRTTYEQLAKGKRVTTPRAGDIVVLGGGSHVGIYVSPGVMIDAGNPRVGVSQRAIYATPTAYLRFG